LTLISKQLGNPLVGCGTGTVNTSIIAVKMELKARYRGTESSP
jgi:hypothetical protein